MHGRAWHSAAARDGRKAHFPQQDAARVLFEGFIGVAALHLGPACMQPLSATAGLHAAIVRMANVSSTRPLT